MGKNNKIIYFFLIFIFGIFLKMNFSLAQEVDHVVISEIQISGETVYDEFIKLYNPTNNDVDLTGWDLKRKTKTGTESNILNNVEGVILSKGFFLIIPRANCGDEGNESCYQGEEILSDEYTTNSYLAKDNTILLYNLDGAVIDKVGWGEAGDSDDGAININPENGQSLERKINGEIIQDTDNSQNDFIVKGNSIQNSSTQENGANEGQNNSANNASKIENNYIVPKIIITEFLPNPEDSDRDNEFIELYNEGENDVDLEGWTIQDKAGKVKTFIIPEKNIIKAKSYKVFYSDETRIALNNSGDGIMLKNSYENIISESSVSDSAKEDQSYSLDDNNKWVWTLRPTPGRENVIKLEDQKVLEKDVEIKDSGEESVIKKVETEKKVEYDFSDQVIISEIFPNPAGRDNTNGLYEWIELYNNSEKDVNLSGWQLDDVLNKGSKPHTIENMIIKANDYILLSSDVTKVILNNSGDEINLLWPDSSVVEKVIYEKSQEGYSYSLSSEEIWFWNEDITPGKENKVQKIIIESEIKDKIEYDNFENFEDAKDQNYLVENNYIDAEIKDLDNFVKYTRVKIFGTVSTPPEIFSDEILYLSGSGEGVQVFYKKGRFPNIQIGDFIEVIGLISEIGGETRVLVFSSEDVKIISRDNFVEPQIISTGEINKEAEGTLVSIEGKISAIKGDTFFVDDGSSGEVKIYIKPQTKIQIGEIQIGDWIVITGQVSRTSLGYRVLPRFQNDIKRGLVSGIANIAEASSGLDDKSISKLNENSENKKSPLFALLAMAGTLIFLDWGRMKSGSRK